MKHKAKDKIGKSAALPDIAALLGDIGAGDFEDLCDLLEGVAKDVGVLDTADLHDIDRLLREAVIFRHQGDVVPSSGGRRRMEEALILLAVEFRDAVPSLSEICGPTDFWMEILRDLAARCDDIVANNSGGAGESSPRNGKQRQRQLGKQQKRWGRLFGEYARNFPQYAAAIVKQFIIESGHNQLCSIPLEDIKLDSLLATTIDSKVVSQGGGKANMKIVYNAQLDAVEKLQAESKKVTSMINENEHEENISVEDGNVKVAEPELEDKLKNEKNSISNRVYVDRNNDDVEMVKVADDKAIAMTYEYMSEEYKISKEDVPVKVAESMSQENFEEKMTTMNIDKEIESEDNRDVKMMDIEDELTMAPGETTVGVSRAKGVEHGEVLQSLSKKDDTSVKFDIENIDRDGPGQNITGTSNQFINETTHARAETLELADNSDSQLDKYISDKDNAFSLVLNRAIPEIVFYADILDSFYEAASDNHTAITSGRNLRRCLGLFDTLEKAKESDEMKDWQRANDQDLPELKKLNKMFYYRWILRNRSANSWISEPEPDFADPDERASRLQAMSLSLSINGLFTTDDYNFVFLRKDGKQIKHIVHKWIKSSKINTELSTKQLISIVFNLLRRQEDWEQDFIKLLNSQALYEPKIAAVGEFLTPKGLFYVAFQHSTTELRVKLMKDFADAGHPAPLVFPSWPSNDTFQRNEVNSFVYHALPASTSIGVFSLGIGPEGCQQLGKSELINRILGTQFECGNSSFFKYGTVDLDCGAAFHPDRRICVSDTHGRLEERLYPILHIFSHIIVHVTAKDLKEGSMALHKDLNQLKKVMELSYSCKLFLLIRDAGYCNLSAEFVDERDELFSVFPLIGDMFGKYNKGTQSDFFPLAFPDLRVGGVLDEKMRQEVCDILLRKPI